jgi:hypothetical protein
MEDMGRLSMKLLLMPEGMMVASHNEVKESAGLLKPI